jgi:hypothetical protein
MGSRKGIRLLKIWKGKETAISLKVERISRSREYLARQKGHLHTTTDQRIPQGTSHGYKDGKGTKGRVNGWQRDPSFHHISHPSLLPTHIISYICNSFACSFTHLCGLYSSQHTRGTLSPAHKSGWVGVRWTAVMICPLGLTTTYFFPVFPPISLITSLSPRTPYLPFHKNLSTSYHHFTFA